MTPSPNRPGPRKYTCQYGSTGGRRPHRESRGTIDTGGWFRSDETIRIFLALLIAIMERTTAFVPTVGSAARVSVFFGLASAGFGCLYTGWRALQFAAHGEVQVSSAIQMRAALYAPVIGG